MKDDHDETPMIGPEVADRALAAPAFAAKYLRGRGPLQLVFST